MEILISINLDVFKDTEIMSLLAQGIISQEEFLRWKKVKGEEQDREIQSTP